MKALWTGLWIQEVALRALVESVDRKFQTFEWHFNKIVDQLDALALGANRRGNKNRRRLRGDVTQGQPINKLVLAYNHRQPFYIDDSEEDDDSIFTNHRPARGSGKNVHDFNRDGSNFRLKVDISYFNSNLIEDFIDWLQISINFSIIWRSQKKAEWD